MSYEPHQHYIKQFDTELEALRARVLQMGGLVEEQIMDSIEALTTGNLDLASRVIAKDARINALEVVLDEDCNQLIARRQPAASDLRLIMTVIKLITDLERIGDEAERIAKVALESFSSAQQDLLVNLENMGRHVAQMLHDVLDAFARMDVEAALAVYKEDKKVDREYEAITRQLMTYMMEDPRSIPKIMNVLWSARALERIGDRCKNISEYVISFVKGRDVRHSDEDSLEQNARS